MSVCLHRNILSPGKIFSQAEQGLCVYQPMLFSIKSAPQDSHSMLGELSLHYKCNLSVSCISESKCSRPKYLGLRRIYISHFKLIHWYSNLGEKKTKLVCGLVKMDRLVRS